MARPRAAKKSAPSRTDLWISLALVIAILAVYSGVGSHQFVDYDDNDYIASNPHVRDGFTWSGIRWAFTSVDQSNWFPLTWLSHMLDCEWFGLNAGAHHLMSLAIHALATLALFAALKRLTKARWPSAFVALAFALHPLHVESVAWAAERKDVLSALFWCLTLWAYAIYAERPSRPRYAAVLALFACGLMSKPMTVTLPFVLLLIDYWPLKRRAIAEKLPMFAMSAAASAVTFIAQRRGGAVAETVVAPLVSRMENALVSYAVYLENFFWPSNLAVFYPYVEPAAWAWISAGFVLAAISVFVVAQRTARPFLAVGWFWYLGTLAPVIGLIQAGSQARADRYTYLPTIGISIMIAWACAEFVSNRRALAIAVTAIGVAWAVLTGRNVANWQSTETLFTHAIEVTDGNYVAYNNLGNLRRREGRFEDAAADFESAVRIQPSSADAQDNLGVALTALGRIDDAVPHLRDAIALRPDLAKPHIDLGSALMRSGHPGEAISEFERALAIDPQSGDAEYNLAGALASTGHRDQAMPHFEKALPFLVSATTQNPDDADAHYNLGAVYGMIGRSSDAAAQFSEVVRLRPNDPEARYNLGVALSGEKQFDHAAEQFSAAIGLRPDYAAAHLALARALVSLGRTTDAIAEYSETLRLAPALEPARQELNSLKSKP
jgi:protein O-mannosyl-transferase